MSNQLVRRTDLFSWESVISPKILMMITIKKFRYLAGIAALVLTALSTPGCGGSDGKNGSSGMTVSASYHYFATNCTGAELFGTGAAACMNTLRLTVFSDGSSYYAFDINTGAADISLSGYVAAPAGSNTINNTLDGGGNNKLQLVMNTSVSPPAVSAKFSSDGTWNAAAKAFTLAVD